MFGFEIHGYYFMWSDKVVSLILKKRRRTLRQKLNLEADVEVIDPH